MLTEQSVKSHSISSSVKLCHVEATRSTRLVIWPRSSDIHRPVTPGDSTSFAEQLVWDFWGQSGSGAGFYTISGFSYQCYYHHHHNHHHHHHLVQLDFHSVVVVVTLAQTKQVRINVHKLNNTKHSKYKYTYYQNTHILQTHTYTRPHVTKQVKTTAVQDTHEIK